MKKNVFLILFSLTTSCFLRAQESYKLAEKEFDKDNYEKAITYYTESIQKKEEVAKSYNYRGMAYLYSEKMSEAQKDLEYHFNLTLMIIGYTSVSRVFVI
ncbi:hypothetical protein [Chryseobacterium sp. SIMBA_038]|uniref:hypothetical protein n=1 Tax=Chryseobacterium sp. SIMBA_038 TaxID=3085780 RepID=UPI003979859D